METNNHRQARARFTVASIESRSNSLIKSRRMKYENAGRSTCAQCSEIFCNKISSLWIKVKFTIIAVYMSPITIPAVLGTVLPKRPITIRPERKQILENQNKDDNKMELDNDTTWKGHLPLDINREEHSLCESKIIPRKNNLRSYIVCQHFQFLRGNSWIPTYYG